MVEKEKDLLVPEAEAVWRFIGQFSSAAITRDALYVHHLIRSCTCRAARANRADHVIALFLML